MTKKKFFTFLIIFLLIAFAGTAQAINWTVANQSTLKWDAVTKTSSGVDIPAGDTITYEIYIVKEGADKDTAVKVGDTTELLYTITFAEEGRWIAGIKAVRTPAAAPENKTESTITWSDTTDAAAVPVPFGFIYFEAPANVGGLTPQ